jgi:3-oxoacyl-[acyl-carrier-protein] synthase-3
MVSRAESVAADPITLEVVESYFPERVVTVEERAAQLELTPAQTHMFRRIQGLDRMHYDPQLSLLDVIVPAAQKVLAQTDDPSRVRFLLYGQTFQGLAGSPTDVAQELKEVLGLDRALAFTVTQQNCAVPLSAIDMAGALLNADDDPDALALIVTGDKPRQRSAQLVMNTCMVADGGASGLLARAGRGPVLSRLATAAKGEYSDGMAMTPDQRRDSAEKRPQILLAVMEEAAARAGCRLPDLQIIVPTNPNATYWPETIKDPGLLDKFFVDNVARYSHCLGADAFINYVTLREQNRLRPGRPAMFVGVGIGMTFSAMVFTPGTEGPRS